MDLETYLSQPDHRRAVGQVVRQALEEIAPYEIPIVDPYIDPLIDEAATGEPLAMNTWDLGGDFGDADLLIFTIIPSVLLAISNYLAKRSHERPSSMHASDIRLLIAITEDEIRVIARRTGSEEALKSVHLLARSINEILGAVMEDDSNPEASTTLASITYQDFGIVLERFGKQYRAQVLPSAGGSSPSLFELPWSGEDLKRRLTALGGTVRGETRDTRRAEAQFPIEEPETVGRTLFETLFKGGIRDAYHRRLGTTRDRREGLRIRLVLDTDEPTLCALPWELLYDPDTRRFLALDPNTPIVRYLRGSGSFEPRSRPVTEPLRVLTVDARPQGQEALQVDRERLSIEDFFLERKRIKPEPLHQATVEELRRSIRNLQPHVLHFMGHGDFDHASGLGSLLMAGPTGQTDPLTGRDLAVVLRGCDSIRAVVLNACHTGTLPRRNGINAFGGVASALVAEGFPAVVAMQFAITDSGALAFSRGFYEALASGNPVDSALGEARQALFNLDRARRSYEWATPVLYLSVADGQFQ